MTLGRKLRSALAGAGMAAQAVLTPVTSKLEEPQAQTVPDRDYEGVKRSAGGGFQPADEVREDAWVVQSRSSQDARDFFYGGRATDTSDAGAPAQRRVVRDAMGNERVEVLPAQRPSPTKSATVLEGFADHETSLSTKPQPTPAANHAEWERRRQQLARAGLLARERPRSLTERAHDSGLGPEGYARTMDVANERGTGKRHTCGERPLEPCEGCLEVNR